jgi:oleandomycin transport system permease protein
VSNVFVPSNTLPGWLQPIVNANPVSILSDAVRGLLVGGPVFWPTVMTVLWAAAITLVFAPLGVSRFKKRV